VTISAEQTKCKLNAHFECLRRCVDSALSERLATLLQAVDDAVQESVVPLERCEQQIQERVDIAAQILDSGGSMYSVCIVYVFVSVVYISQVDCVLGF